MKVRGILVLFLIVFSMTLVYAEHDVGNLSHLLTQEYGPGESITGWVNISFDNEEVSSIFDNGRDNTITLRDLLEKNTDYEKTCIPKSCLSNYDANVGSQTQAFDLNAGEEQVFGLKISGGIVDSISGFSIDVSSNVAESNKIPLAIDILNNKEFEWIAYNGSGNFQDKYYGYYEENQATNYANLVETEYCSKIKLSPSPGIKIGAEISEISGQGGNADFRMIIENDDSRGSCDIDVTSEGSQSCIPSNFAITTTEYFYVCIWAKDSEDQNKYKIKYEEYEPRGYSGNEENKYDFAIFVQPEKYNAVENFTLDNDELDAADSYTTNIEREIEDYLYNTYGNNCSNDCVIPIRFISGESQQIQLSNIGLSYEKSGISQTNDNLYELEEVPAKVSSDFQKLFLDEAEFPASENYGKFTFKLYLNNYKLFQEELNTTHIPIITAVTPITTASAYPTKFKVFVSSSTNITKYEWDFGDDDTESTTTNKVTHTYNSTGNYYLIVNVTDSNQKKSSKTFNISVGSAEGIIEDIIAKDKLSLSKIKSQINNFSLFYKESLNGILNISFIEQELIRLETEYNTTADSEEDFREILTNLLDLEIPESIAKTITAPNIFFNVVKEQIDLGAIEAIAGGDSSEYESEYKEAVVAWNSNSTEIKVDFTEISFVYDGVVQPMIRFFELDINELGSLDYDYYLFLKKLEDLKFDYDYSEQEEGDYIYILLSSTNTIGFSTTEEVDFTNLPAFISPAISELQIIKIDPDVPGTSKWIFFGLAMALLFIVALITYLILQAWYKKRYENYLFKNRNNLYNLIIYIETSKKRGLSEDEIRSKLKKAGWGGEQIRYVMRKHSGQRTGMFEIPILKIFSSFKKREPQPLGRILPPGFRPRPGDNRRF